MSTVIYSVITLQNTINMSYPRVALCYAGLDILSAFAHARSMIAGTFAANINAIEIHETVLGQVKSLEDYKTKPIVISRAKRLPRMRGGDEPWTWSLEFFGSLGKFRLCLFDKSDTLCASEGKSLIVAFVEGEPFAACEASSSEEIFEICLHAGRLFDVRVYNDKGEYVLGFPDSKRSVGEKVSIEDLP